VLRAKTNELTPPGIAFRFVSLTEEDTETIRGFLKKRDPLFFEEVSHRSSQNP
jgi:hypothetical protein